MSKGTPSMHFNCMDLFAGVGGLSEGFRQADFHTVVANEFDPHIAATYRANHERFGTRMIEGDIALENVQAELLEHISGIQIDVLIGGPPCQAFSQVRNHHRIIDDPRNSLYRHFVAMVDTVKPKFFVMENVPGLQNIAGGAVRNQILEDLSLNGDYRVRSRVLDAAAYGVPQSRLRVFFFGVRADLSIDPDFPTAIKYEGLKLDRILKRGRWTYQRTTHLEALSAAAALADPENTDLVTVEQAIGDLLHLRPAKRLVRRPSDASVSYEAGPLSAYQRARRIDSSVLFNADVPSIREDTVARLQAIPQGGNFRDLPERLAARYLGEERWGPDIGKDTLSRKYFFAYRKLHPEFFSWTLNTKADCVYHYSYPRALSVREFARINSFDDTYHILYGDRHSRYRQIGNAVPPLLARAVARSIRAALLQVHSSVADCASAAA